VRSTWPLDVAARRGRRCLGSGVAARCGRAVV